MTPGSSSSPTLSVYLMCIMAFPQGESYNLWKVKTFPQQLSIYSQRYVNIAPQKKKDPEDT